MFISKPLSLTQVVVIQYETTRYVKSIYWISTAATFLPSMHCLLITSLLIVYGPNLAIRGPLGSMVKAIKGMVIEQVEVFWSFVISLILFCKYLISIPIVCSVLLLKFVAISVTATFWLEAYLIEAYLCTIIMVIGAFAQYHYCLRIKNRFQFDEEFRDQWDKAEHERKIVDDSEQPLRGKIGLDEGNASDSASNSSGRTYKFGQSSVDNVSKNKSTLRKLFHLSFANNNSKNQESANNSTNTVPTANSTAIVKVFKEGFMSVKKSNDRWVRYYCVLSNNLIWIYADKFKYDNNPNVPHVSRPIDMEYYVPMVISQYSPFQIKLQVNTTKFNLVTWEFMLDTLEELNDWMRVLQLSAQCNSTNPMISS